MTKRLAILGLVAVLAAVAVSPAVGGPPVGAIAEKALKLAKKNKKEIAETQKAIADIPAGPPGAPGAQGGPGVQGPPGTPVTFRRQGGPQAQETVLSAGGLELTYACSTVDPSDPANLVLNARSTVDNSTVTAGGAQNLDALGDTAFQVQDDDFDSGQTLEVGPTTGGGQANSSYVAGTLTFATPAGAVVSVVYDAAEIDPDGCRAAATAVGP